VHEHSSSRRRRLFSGTGTLALSLGLCLSAGQLVSTPAASAATPTKVVQAAAVAKAKPSIQTKYSTRTLRSGSAVKVTAKVFKPANGKAAASAAAKGSKILAEAKRHTGALYKFAAAGPMRFDCSGYTLYVYRKAVGVKLPHKANSQQRYGKAIAKGSKKVGDLIVFRSGSYGYHAGIYAGGGYMYDSPHTGARVGKHKIWSNNYVVRRLAG